MQKKNTPRKNNVQIVIGILMLVAVIVGLVQQPKGIVKTISKTTQSEEQTTTISSPYKYFSQHHVLKPFWFKKQK